MTSSPRNPRAGFAAAGAVLAASLCFATTGTAQALAATTGSPTSVGAARIVLGGTVLGLVALLGRRRLPNPDAGGSRRRFVPWAGQVVGRRVSSPVVVLIGALGVVGYQPAFFFGTRSNGVAIGTLVALGSAPIFTGVATALLQRRRPERGWVIGTGLALVGVTLISGLMDATAAPLSLPGLLGSVGAGSSYALYTLAAKELMDRGWSFLDAMGALFSAAGLLGLPLLAGTDVGWLFTPQGLVLVAWLGLVTTAVAYLLFGWGLARLEAPTVSVLTLAEPLGATLLGLVLLGERLSSAGVLGIVVLVAGLVVVALPTPRAGRTRP